jgi:opacity protein-like surface antigen
MKKKLIYSSVLTALLSASSVALAGGPEIIPAPDYFSGFYIGGMGGVNHMTYDGTSSVNQASPLESFFGVFKFIDRGPLDQVDLAGGGWGGFGGIQGGFGREVGEQYYVGVEAWGDWGSTSDTNSQNNSFTSSTDFPSFHIPVDDVIIITDPTRVGRSVNANVSTTVKIRDDAGVAAKLGWVVAPRSMIYGKIGASWANIKVSNSASANSAVIIDDLTVPARSRSFLTEFNGSSENSDTKTGLLLGVGFEQFVYEDVVSLNVEYDYTSYGSVSTGPATIKAQIFNNDTGDAITQPFNTKATTQANITNVQVSKLLAGLNFYFGRNWF